MSGPVIAGYDTIVEALRASRKTNSRLEERIQRLLKSKEQLRNKLAWATQSSKKHLGTHERDVQTLQKKVDRLVEEKFSLQRQLAQVKSTSQGLRRRLKEK